MPRSVDPADYINVPLLYVSGDKIVISVDPGRLGVHPAAAPADGESNVPALSPEQHAALAVLNELATKHKHRLGAKQGDMVFINNLALLHARDTYVDPKDGPGRHLVRLWIRNPELAWNIPESMAKPWEAAFGRNGDGFPSLDKLYPTSPPSEYRAPTYTAGSAAFLLEDSDDVNAGSTI